MANQDDALLRFQFLIPFYVNETLDDEDLAFFEAFLKDNPKYEASIQFDRYVQSALINHAKEYKSKDGADQLIARLKADRKKQWFDYFKPNFKVEYLRPALAFCLVIIAAETLVISQLQSGNSLANLNATRGVAGAIQYGNRFKIMLKPQAQHAEVTRLMQQAQCEMIAGPTDNGELTIVCNNANIASHEILKDAKIIDDVITTVK